MRKVMIIGAGAGQVPLIEESKRRGLYTCVVSPWGNYPGIELADKHIDEDVYNKDVLVKIAKDLDIDYVLSDQSDFAVPTVAYIAEKVGLLGNTISVAEFYSDKHTQRDFCLANDFFVPKSEIIDSVEQINSIKIPFPWVIKPVDSQGSRGIKKVQNAAEAIDAYNDALIYSKKGKVVAEECFDGQEVVCEGFVVDGEYYNIGFGDRKYFNLPDVFIPSQTIFPSVISESIQTHIIEHERHITKAAGAKFGIVHAEYLINGAGDFRLVETALRGGGVYISSHLIPNAFNINLTNLLLDYVLEGKDCVVRQLQKINNSKTTAYVCFYLKPGEIESAEGYEVIQNNPYIIQADIEPYKPGFKYDKMLHKGMRLGPVLVVADTRRQLEEQLEWLKNNYIIRLKNNSENAIIWD